MWTITPVAFSDAAQGRPPGGCELLSDSRGQIARVGARPDLVAGAVEHRPGSGNGLRVVAPADELIH